MQKHKDRPPRAALRPRPHLELAQRIIRPPRVEPLLITSLAQVEALFAEELKVHLVVHGQKLTFTGRMLRPFEQQEIKMLLDRTLPPLKEVEGKPPEYDYLNPEYQKTKEQVRRQARALTVWKVFEIFRKQAESEAEKAEPREGTRPTDWTLENITTFVEGRQIDDDALELLFKAATQRVVSAEAFMDFSSGGSSPKS